MRRRFNQSLLPTHWNPSPEYKSFCPKTFGNWIRVTQHKYNVSTVMLEDWGFNSQTLARWRTASQRKMPKYDVLVRFCKAICELSCSGVSFDELIQESRSNLGSRQ